MLIKVAAIVPAFNEEATIGNVVRALVGSGLFSDVIVVSDGSSDRTADEAGAAGATVYELPKNRGKGQAMAHGVAMTDAPILFFSDADLYGFKKEHMEAILAPVFAGSAAMSVGIRDRGKFLSWVSMHTPPIGGERAMLRGVFEHIPDNLVKGFMVEMALNAHCSRHGLKVARVMMPGVTIKKKMQKVGFWRGLIGYIKMFWQVGKAAVVVRLGWLRNKF
ncbi:glycosyltransferase [Candidatus Uhrbacteria bacterium]|nr:glycosyltransferase [Candidatus Uhrbacteria bacterium]